MSNPLLDYDQYTYNWTFSLLDLSSAQAISDGGPYDPSVHNTVVIAESGATMRYSVSRVEIISNPNGSTARNRALQSMFVDILESGSDNFLDRVLTITNQLGYQPDSGYPILAELEFKGYQGSSFNQSEKAGIPINLSHLKKTFLLDWVDTKIKPKHVSGNVNLYSLELLPMKQLFKQEFLKGHSGNFQTKPTLAASLESLATVWNKHFFDTNPALRPLYNNDKMLEIFVDGTIANLPLLASGDNQGKTNDSGNVDLAFKSNDDIFTIVEKILYYVKRGDTSDPKKAKMVPTKVVPKAVLVGYSEAQQKHVYRYEVYVKEFKSFDAHSIDELKNKFNYDGFKELFQQAIDPTIRHYTYTNSGLNTDVIRLEYDLNNSWQYVISKNQTNLITASLRDAEQAPHTNQVLAIDEKISKDSRGKEKGQTKDIPVTGTRVYLEDAENSEGWDTFNAKFPAKIKFDDKGKAEGNLSGNDLQVVANFDQTETYYNADNLLEVRMKLIGDPYWLGYSDQELEQAIKPNNVRTFPYSADFTRQEALFSVSFNSAPTFDEHTLSQGSSFLGKVIYQANEIKSTFQNGVFHQDIVGYSLNNTLNSNSRSTAEEKQDNTTNSRNAGSDRNQDNNGL